MRQIVRKVLTRPLWWWERHRPYPIRRKVFRLQPVEFRKESSTCIVVLTTPKGICEAAWTARSMAGQLDIRTGLIFAVDGRIGEAVQSQLSLSFPGCEIMETAQFVLSIRESSPSIFALSAYHPMGRKLATILSLQQRSNILFADNDVLAFNPLTEVSEAMRSGIPSNLYLQEIGNVATEGHLFEAVEKLGLPFARTINVGLLLIRLGSLSLPTAESILSFSGKITSWFPDTMILSVLMEMAGSKALPRERVRRVRGPSILV